MKSTTEKRKEVCRLLKDKKLEQHGIKPKQPSKVIYNLKAEQLDRILRYQVIRWDELQDVISRIWGNDTSDDGENGKPNGNSDENDGEKPANSDESGDEIPEIQADKRWTDEIPEIKADTSRQYVTTNGMVSAQEIAEDLNLSEFAKKVGLGFELANDKMSILQGIVDQAVKASEDNIGIGEIVINIDDSPPVIFEDEHLHPAFERILFHLKADKNVYLFGSAGAGKTTSAIQAQKALGLEKFACYSCTAGMSEGLITGRLLFDGSFFDTEFNNIWENGGLILLDEFDAIDGNLAVVLNSALANGILHVPNRKSKPMALRHKDCYVLGAGNTDGCGNGSRIYAGRNKLDGATLDRFTAIKFEYDSKLEKKLSGGQTMLFKALNKVRKAVDTYEINRVVSTRAFLKCAKWMSGGKDLDYCLNTLTESWTEFELEKVDLSGIISACKPAKKAEKVEEVKSV